MPVLCDNLVPPAAVPRHTTTPTCDKTDRVPVEDRDNASPGLRNSSCPRGHPFPWLHTSATRLHSPHNPALQYLPPGFASCVPHPARPSPVGFAPFDILWSRENSAGQLPSS